MKLSQLIVNDFYLPLEWDREFNHIVTDTRQLKQGDLFIARQGLAEHGAKYIDQAIELGAVAVLVEGEMGFESKDSPFFPRVPVFYAEEVATCLPQWLARRYPAATMNLIAVTGTNGKSSTSQYIAQLAALCEQPCAVLGTLGNGIWPNLQETTNTTADLAVIRRQLDHYHEQGVGLAALEVSSHGLVQQRVTGLSFSVAIMTNLSQDHLDYHGSMDAYLAAKKQLFTEYGVQHALINIDDEYGQQLAADSSITAAKLTYGAHASADVRYQLLAFDNNGLHAEVRSPWGTTQLVLPLMGEFNVANAVAAISALALQGYDFLMLCDKAQQLHPVAGRMELYQKAGAPLAVIDFAHTPAALINVLQALQPWQRPLTTVFGCGGDRDRSKRPLMMQAALAHSNSVWLTDDNVRFEDPQQIFADALAAGQPTAQVHDRQQAITEAIAACAANGIVLIAGKGHEAYQDIQGVKHSYSDKAVLLSLGYQLIGGAHA